MTRLKFISSGIKNNVILKLESSNKFLTSAKSKAGSLDIPDFPCSSYLSNLSNNISKIINSCTEDINWLEDSLTNFQAFNDEHIDCINKVEVKEVTDKGIHVNLIE